MHQSRLIQLLGSLSVKECTQFGTYIDSPFFNKNKKVRLLGELLLEKAPRFEKGDLDREQLYAAVYQENEFHRGRFNNLLSDLLHLLYDFLAMREYQSHPQLRRHLLLEDLLKREQHRDIERIARWYRKLQDSTPYRHNDFYLDEFRLYDKLDRYFFTKGYRIYDENLQLKNDQLDLFYIISKLRIACDMTSRNLVTDSAYQCSLLDELLDYCQLNEGIYQAIPAFGIYLKILQMLRGEDDEQSYREAKELLYPNHQLFPQEELRELYIFVLNYCIRQINSGKSRFYREILDLYQAMLDNRVVFKNGYIPQWTFKNITTAGIRLKEFNWTEAFILKYGEQLLPEERKNALAFNLAALYYAQKDYARALSQLHDVEFMNTSYHLGAKIIQLKSYYELDESEALLALIEASRKYVGRNRQLSDHGKRANLNFFKLIRVLYSLKNNRKTMRTTVFNKKHRHLQERLQQLEPIANKDWLEDTFGQLAKR